MKNKLLSFCSLVLLSACAAAQTNTNMAVSVGAGASFSSANSTGGPGFSANVELPFTTQLNFIVSAGYFVNFFSTRNNPLVFESYLTCYGCGVPEGNIGPVNKGPYEFIPLKAGLRYYYFRHFYIDGLAGEAIKANVTDNSFIYGGALGGLIPFNRHHSLDINAGYENGYKFADYNPAASEVAFRIAYRYQF